MKFVLLLQCLLVFVTTAHSLRARLKVPSTTKLSARTALLAKRSVGTNAKTKALIVLTNHGVVKGTNKPTGWWLPECTHPFFVFKNAGYDVEFASINGGSCPVSPDSLKLMDDIENEQFWQNAETRSLTENTKVLSNCDADAYDIVFFAGGFGTMFDFPFAPSVCNIVKNVYENGGIVGAVCHGPIAFMNVKLSNGQYFLKGKEVTAFSDDEEAGCDLLDELPNHHEGKTCESLLAARGGRYSKGKAWSCHVVSSDRLFTGQNPSSAKAVAQAIVAAASK